jgi:hypothetical protein
MRAQVFAVKVREWVGAMAYRGLEGLTDPDQLQLQPQSIRAEHNNRRIGGGGRACRR